MNGLLSGHHCAEPLGFLGFHLPRIILLSVEKEAGQPLSAWGLAIRNHPEDPQGVESSQEMAAPQKMPYS